MQKMLDVTIRYWSLQNPETVDWTTCTVRQYKEMYEVFFQDSRLIPSHHLHELSFENLEADALGSLRDIYDAQDLPDFGYVQPRVQQHLDSIRGYEKNTHARLSNDMRERLRREWGMCFETWGYSTE
jgi:hypothetical protein